MKCMCTVFALLLIFISVTAPTVANEADWMPDANLRSAVRSALSMADDDALTQQDMQDLTSLTARNSQISDITGLEHATKLTSLDVRDNAITDVTPLAALTNLEALRLKGNTVSDMSALSGLTNLTLLNLRLTGISSVSALSGLTNLEHLRVDANSITDVEPLTSLRNLRKLWIAGNTLTNAHLLSSLTNLTTLDITIPDPPDTTAPDVSISVPSEVQNGAFDVNIRFTEAVSGFEEEDLSVGGTATASITDWNTTDNTVFTAEITPTTSGEVTLDIAEDVATDAANNPNTAATPKTVTVTIADPQEPIVDEGEGTDTVAPDVNISVPVVPQNGAFDVNIRFTESVSGFEEEDVSVGGTATADITAWSGKDNTVFTATITPTTSGEVTLDIAEDVATDAANNPNTAASTQTVTVDVDVPTVVISAPFETQNGAFDVIITFTEAVSDFESTELSLGGTAIADITDWNTTDNTVFTAEITPTTSGEVTLDIAEDVATDAANNPNTAATPKTVTVTIADPQEPIVDEGEGTDTVAPDVNISVPVVPQNGAFDVNIRFTESVSGFEEEDVSLGGTATADITAWSGKDNTVFTATITPTTSGEVTLDIAEDVATDAANNPNTAASTQTVTVDVDAPTVVISAPFETQNGAFDVIITFTEAVSDFESTELSLGGTATADITDWNTTDNTVFTAEITPTTSGEVTLDIAEDVATDTADNSNSAATPLTVRVVLQQNVEPDTTSPSVSISVPSDTQAGAFYATIRFSEAVFDFVQGDVSLSGTATVSITAWEETTEDTVFTATITPTTSGTVILNVAENVATDAAGNPNTAAVRKTMSIILPGSPSPEVPDVDTTPPDVDITVDLERTGGSFGSYKTNGPFTMTITFTESVSGFEQSDIFVYKGSVTIDSFNTSDNETYIVEITPEINDDNRVLVFEIPAGAATDAAGNPSTSDVFHVYIDFERPGTFISVPDSNVETETFTIGIKFTDAHNWQPDRTLGFDQSDLSLTNNTAGATITDWNARQDYGFTAEVTVTQSGSVTFGVAENVATDAAGNPNTAAVRKTMSIILPGSPSPEVPDVDTTLPDVDITVDLERTGGSFGSYKTNGPFTMTITFTESVSGFEQSDIFVYKGSVTIDSFNTSDNETYIVEITPEINDDNRVLVFEIPAGAATDAAGNPSTSDVFHVYIDFERPGTFISVPDSNVETETFTIGIKFTDAWQPDRTLGFDQSDLSLTNNTAGATITDWNARQDYGFTAEVTVTQSGSVTFGVAENVATDAAGNPNTAAVRKTMSIILPGSPSPEVPDVDTTLPDVDITVDLERTGGSFGSYKTNGPFTMTITFTESVSGFEQSDIFVYKGSVTIDSFNTSDNETYIVEITPEINDDNRVLVFEIPAGAATDAAGNPNTSDVFHVYIDFERPGTFISVPDSNVETETFTIGIKFTDAHNWQPDRTLGFDQSDLSLTNNTAGATITDWNARQDYGFTAEVTVTQSGSVTFSVAEGVATDIAGNLNTASTLKTVKVNLGQLDVNLTVPSNVQNGVFDATITFTESVSDFVQTDLVLFGTATSTITAWNTTDNTTYTAEITPTTSGTVTLSIAVGVATDAANNSNTAATSQTVNIEIYPAWDVNADGNVDITDVALVNAALGQTGTAIADPRTDVNRDSTVDDDDVLLVLENLPSSPWDVNEDGNVDISDVVLVTLALGQSGDGIVNSRTDVNMNGTVDNADLLLVTGHLDANNGAPLRAGMLTLPDRATLETLDSAILEGELDILRAESDGSVKYLLAIMLLESILESRRPDETRLLANYPNPFNPETWIPYQLANPSDVQITIYDVRGTVIRRLDLGHQREDYYTSRGRAAYWDGRNAVGERVASGLYFYQLEADSLSLLRKMLILK